MTESVEEFYSRNAKKYDNTHSTDDWSKEFRENISEFCELVDGKVLDAGCGPGVVTDFLSKKGFETIGIDIASGMIEYAQDRKEGTYQKMDISNLEFGDNEFAGIWCGSTIFFLNEKGIEHTLEEFRRVLKEEGILYIDFKEGSGKYTKEKWNSKVEEYRLSREKAIELLNNYGFSVLRSKMWENSRGANYLEFICRKE